MQNYYKERNSWCVRIYVGTDADGKKKYKKLKAPSIQELDKKVYQFKKEMDSGLDVYKANDSLEKWRDRFILSMENEVECGDYQESELNMIKARLKYFIEYNNGVLAKARLNDILSSHIQPAVNALYKYNPSTKKPTSKRTLERYIRALANVFEFARKQRAYNYCNPCDEVKIPKNAALSKRTAINGTMLKLVLTTDHRAKLPAMIMVMAGLRRGELTALTWGDIDLKKREISVNKSYDFKGSTVKGTKTEAGNRNIPINDMLYTILCDEKKKAKSLIVVEKISGGIMTEQAWKVLFRSYMLALENAYDQMIAESPSKAVERFEPFTIHQLRHTYCSMLQWSGVDIKTAQELMGHSEYEVTANIYTHVNDEQKKRAVNLQNEYIRNYLIS